VVDEAFAGSGGTDTVIASVSVNLGDATRYMGDIERVTLVDGIAGLNATGNGLANLLIGNNLGNTLNGGAGADTMRGMNGFDIYIVDNLGDVVDESVAGSGGTDTVQASVSVDLTDTARFKGAIERVTLAQGIAGLNATGNELANIITGSAFGNFINGKGGNDTLTGGLGVDRFVFDTALNAASNVDRITDFSVKDDTIQLDDAIFATLGAPGTLAASLFRNTASGPVDADDRIVYDAATGALSYDADASGASAAILFATLSAGLALTNRDFVII
jgi:Ca2+-binding RTX toxin-like protein